MKRRSRILDPGITYNEHVVTWFQQGYGSTPNVIRQLPEDLQPGVSVVICTYKRTRSVMRLFDSLTRQIQKPDQLIIVDASPDDETYRAVRLQHFNEIASRLLYFRVEGPLKGLTRQRNFGLRWVANELVAFFDDDTVLMPDCIAEMAQAQRLLGDRAVGVGGRVENVDTNIPTPLRLKRLFGAIPDLRPGTYTRSGGQIGWDHLQPSNSNVEGDWLQGCAAMWKTSIAREIGFNEEFDNYCNLEDLEFSRKMASHGKLFVAGRARLLHLHDSSGRPDPVALGYQGLRNAYLIHCSCIPNRTWKDATWFFYNHGLDTLWRAFWLVRPGKMSERLAFLRGRLRFFWELLRPRESR